MRPTITVSVAAVPGGIGARAWVAIGGVVQASRPGRAAAFF